MGLITLEKALSVIFFLITSSLQFSWAQDKKYVFNQPINEFEVIQLEDFCDSKSETTQCSRMNENNLKFFFSIFMSIAWGGAIRTIIKTFELSIPYTVVLLITGLGIGLGSRINTDFCQTWSQFTKFARSPPDLILYIFLPVLIFESAFSMKAHVFITSFLSIIVVALPGMIIATFVTAVACRQFMNSYEWTFSQASLFGAIISATDPVAVVAILRELGTSEILSVMIEGESLLNDGVAILLYHVFKEIVETPEDTADLTKRVVRQFVQIAIGGPLFGWLMGKASIWCLSLIFNDAATEITITLVSAYLTYFVGEFYLKVSGVMAVVLLGVTINAGNTCISPEVVHTVHQFWNMMSFLANTVLFILLGIVISETAINSYEATDGWNAIALYVVLNLIRLVVLLLLSPLLKRTGFDTSWENILVMMWGGLRGAVGICLALEVYKNKKLCNYEKLGPKILLQTAGIVIMTLIFNGSTTKTLLDYLGVTTISIGKIQDMAHAVRNLTAARVRTIIAMKHDRFLADANWEMVSRFTHLKDPYAKKQKSEKDHKQQSDDKLHEKKITDAPSIIAEKLIKGGHLSSALLHDKSKGVAPVQDKEVIHVTEQPSLLFIHQGKLKKQTNMVPDSLLDTQNEFLNQKEHDDDEFEDGSPGYKKAMEESRGRVLKTMKISCWTQYEKGSLSEEAVKVIVNAIEAKEDMYLTMIHTHDLRDHWAIKGIFARIRAKFIKFLQEEPNPPVPKLKCRYPAYRIAISTWFHGLIYCIIFLNLFPIGLETYYLIENIEHPLDSWQAIFLFCSTVSFTILYLLEFLIKVIGRGPRDYFYSTWNLLDFFVLVISLVEAILAIIGRIIGSSGGGAWLQVFKVLRLVRFCRLLRWFRPLIPLLNLFLDMKINTRLFRGYDVGKGYVQALEDALRFLPTMIQHPKISRKFRIILDIDRLKTLHELGVLQMEHPGVVVAVKTRHASRAISGYMKEELETMKFEGILEENEYHLLNSKIDGNLKKLWGTPSSMKLADPEVLLNSISWSVGNNGILGFLQDFKQVKTLKRNDVLFEIGDAPNGIYLITSGLLKLKYEPTAKILDEYHTKGIFPNTEFVLDMTFSVTNKEYLGPGSLIGEYGYLTGLPRASGIRAVTEVTMYHWPGDVLDNAIKLFPDEYDSLESRLWRNVAIRLAGEFLHSTTQYSSWSGDKIRAHLEQGVVPIGDKFKFLEIPTLIQEAILVHGILMNQVTHETIVAPCLVPETWTKIGPATGDDPFAKPIVMLVVHDEEIELLTDKLSVSSLDKCILKAPGVAMTLDDYEDDPLGGLTQSGKHRRRSLFVQSVSNYSAAAGRRKSTFDTGRRRSADFTKGTRHSGDKPIPRKSIAAFTSFK